MSTVGAIQEGRSKQVQRSGKEPKKISWEAFQKEYLTREDGYKYEWLNGVVEKTKRTMDYSQFPILRTLQYFFEELKKNGKVKGLLIAEGDTFFARHHRRPDVAFYTDEQIDQAAEGNPPVPQFLIEIISKNDVINKVNKKMIDYRNAGVPVVWHILPDYEEVHVYHGNKMKIYKGKDVVSAAPVLPDFKMEVAAIFRK